jgi:hypothetical protein
MEGVDWANCQRSSEAGNMGAFNAVATLSCVIVLATLGLLLILIELLNIWITA